MLLCLLQIRWHQTSLLVIASQIKLFLHYFLIGQSDFSSSISSSGITSSHTQRAKENLLFLKCIPFLDHSLLLEVATFFLPPGLETLKLALKFSLLHPMNPVCHYFKNTSLFKCFLSLHCYTNLIIEAFITPTIHFLADLLGSPLLTLPSENERILPKEPIEQASPYFKNIM